MEVGRGWSVSSPTFNKTQNLISIRPPALPHLIFSAIASCRSTTWKWREAKSGPLHSSVESETLGLGVSNPFPQALGDSASILSSESHCSPLKRKSPAHLPSLCLPEEPLSFTSYHLSPSFSESKLSRNI